MKGFVKRGVAVLLCLAMISGNTLVPIADNLGGGQC